jgi:peptidoglycan-associated lipoprotein
MKKTMITLLAGISMFALLTAGCANKEAVKKEEAVVPPAAVEKAEPVKAVEQAQSVEQTQPVQDVVVSAAAPQDAMSPVAEIRLETVYFDFDKSDLRQDTRDVLSKNAEVILKTLAGAKIQIEGHTDERGSAEYNLALGERRAKSAQQYLTTLGVKAENTSVISYGEEKPAVAGDDEGAWAKNRRAEFVIIK